MRGTWRAAAVLLLAGSLPPLTAEAQTGFNGVITFETDRSGKQDTFVQYTKGHKVRIDGFGSDSGWMIIDNDAKAMMVVQPKKQQYFTMTQEDARQMQAMMGPMMERMKQRRSKEENKGKLDFANTGKTETVAGVRCQVWHGAYTDEDGDKDEGEACVAPGVRVRHLTVAHDGLAGEFFTSPEAHGTPIVAIGGSDGQAPTLTAALLARRGHGHREVRLPEQILNVPEAHRGAVEQIVALSRAGEPAGNDDFLICNREVPVAVVEEEEGAAGRLLLAGVFGGDLPYLSKRSLR